MKNTFIELKGGKTKMNYTKADKLKGEKPDLVGTLAVAAWLN
jgi:hypothetical protein